MKLFKKNLSALSITRIFLVGVFLTGMVSAAESAEAASQGVSVLPAIIEEEINAGAEKEYFLTIRNLTATTSTYFLEVTDIVGVREGGVPVLATPDELAPFGASSFIQLSKSEIVLNPQEVAKVPYLLRVSDEVVPGSYFAGIIVEAPAPKIETSGAAVGYQVVSIVNVRVSGDVSGSLRLSDFEVKPETGDEEGRLLPITIQLDNQSPILFQPTGSVVIKNWWGREVFSQTINPAKHSIFPKSQRNFTATWEPSRLAYGPYTIELQLSYNNEETQLLSDEIVYWRLPTIATMVVGGLILVSTISLIGWFFFSHYLRPRIYTDSLRRKRKHRKRVLFFMLTAFVILMIYLVA